MLKKFVIACAVLSTFTGCLTVGEEFPTDITWIKVNTTSRTEIEKRIGTPFRVGYDSGQLTYTFAFYRYNAFTTTRTRDLVVRFTNSNTVASYTFSSSFPEDKAAIDPRLR